MMSEKQERHTMVAWLEDKPGVLNRVSGLFGRRNFNIESLTVGHSETPGISRMTFVALGTPRDMAQIRTQLNKLINVTDIQDVTERPSVTRELALIKVKANGRNRAEVLQLVDIYRAKVVDVALESIIIEIVGPEDRVDSLIELLAHYGIEEMVRTGRIVMERGQRNGSETAVATAYKNGHK
jgi:acetolactate synthase I/III small subunit